MDRATEVACQPPQGSVQQQRQHVWEYPAPMAACKPPSAARIAPGLGHVHDHVLASAKCLLLATPRSVSAPGLRAANRPQNGASRL